MEAKIATDPPTARAGKKVRFVAKGLRSQRVRLGLSASDVGTLVGVSAQSIYNWESGDTRPRDEQIARLAVLRGLGKREVQARLKQMHARKGSNGKR
jgi:predicted transcriptional regulator